MVITHFRALVVVR